MCDMCGEWAPARAITLNGLQAILCSRCYAKVLEGPSGSLWYVVRTFGVEIGHITTE